MMCSKDFLYHFDQLSYISCLYPIIFEKITIFGALQTFGQQSAWWRQAIGLPETHLPVRTVRWEPLLANQRATLGTTNDRCWMLYERCRWTYDRCLYYITDVGFDMTDVG